MSEFKFVQWGKGVPNDYQRLNAMMINEQYLKDKLDPSPRGVLAWKKSDSQTTASVNVFTNFNGIDTVDFDVEENRMIKISFYVYGMLSSNAGTAAPNGSNTAIVVLSIDGSALNSNNDGSVMRFYADTGMTTSNNGGSMTFVYFTDTPLAKGSHSVTPQIAAGAFAATSVTAVPSIRLLVEDIGAFISESS